MVFQKDSVHVQINNKTKGSKLETDELRYAINQHIAGKPIVLIV